MTFFLSSFVSVNFPAVMENFTHLVPFAYKKVFRRKVTTERYYRHDRNGKYAEWQFATRSNRFLSFAYAIRLSD